MAKISIIIPVYNGEKYIGRCLDSILNQTYGDFEIIAIDDGSTDKSLEVLTLYEKNNPNRIKVSTQKNMGVANTRNRGIELTKTKYLMFVDQDDFIDPDFCETYYKAAENGNYDVVLGGFKRPGTANRVINKNVTLRNTPYARYVCTGLWAKLHNTDFVKQSGLRVFHTKYGEDIVFTMHEYAETEKIGVLEGYAGYNWLYNVESVSNTKQSKIIDMLSPHLLLLDKIKEYDSSHTPEHEYFVLQTITFYLLWTGNSAKKEDFIYAYKKVVEWMKTNYPTIHKNKYILLGPSGTPPLNRIAIAGIMILHRIRLVPLFARFYCRST